MKAAFFSPIAKFASVTAIAVAGVAATAATIPFESNGRTAGVSYRDLDLSKKADQQRLTARIRRAAVKVCPAPTVHEARACQLVAFDHVRSSVEAAYASAQGGDRLAAADGKALPTSAN